MLRPRSIVLMLMQSFAVVLLLSSFAFANEAGDSARGPVDPYEAGYERSRFLAAAGVDSELDEAEFKKNKDADKPYVRAFDSWAMLKAFDANRDSTIDWFEADKYRKAVRAAVLGQFDKDKNNRLTGEERDSANKLLAAGRTPKLALPGKGDSPKAQPLVNRTNHWDKDGDGKFSDEERAIYQKEMKERYAKMQAENVRKYDKDGDGKVSGDEWKAANEERMREWREKNPEAAAKYDERMKAFKRQQEERLEKYDANRNGKIDSDEWKAIQADNMKAWKEKNPEAYAAHIKRQREYLDRYDKDGDGKISTEEQRDIYRAQREAYKQQQEERIRQFDKDGDGKLNREESQAANKARYDDWKAKNPEAAKRYEENRKKREEQRKSGQNGQGGGANYRVTPLQGGGLWGGAGGTVIFPRGQGIQGVQGKPGGRVIQVNPQRSGQNESDDDK